MNMTTSTSIYYYNGVEEWEVEVNVNFDVTEDIEVCEIKDSEGNDIDFDFLSDEQKNTMIEDIRNYLENLMKEQEENDMVAAENAWDARRDR